LPASHYASEWSQDHEIRDTDAVTAVAVQYVKETDPAKKEELLLELIRYFHSYVFKYVSMIASGTLPKIGGAINRDVKLFLRLFLPKDSPPTGTNLGKVARTLNLAFKDMPVEEVYNTLVGCLIKALQKYDPEYTNKVRLFVPDATSLAETGFGPALHPRECSPRDGRKAHQRDPGARRGTVPWSESMSGRA
jgi:hypothetical protein